MCFAAGCCYLHLFRAYNTASAEEVFDLDYIVCKFRKYPLVRKIFGYLFSKVSFDFYVPMVRPISSNMYHVFPNEDIIRFSDLVYNMLFSKARIGGLINNDDNVIRVNQGVAAFSRLCETGGMDMNAALADASRKQLVEMIREPTSEVKYLFKPLVNKFVDSKKDVFVVDYSLSAQNIALLQKSFPELNVMVTGKVNHPHAMPAVTRNCAEALILKFLRYEVNVASVIKGKIFLVDIDANYIRHIKRGRFNVHCCNPVCDVRDSARETERRSELMDMVQKGKV